ncbi:TPA: hypothetical protein PXF62_002416 [Mannheimia haemolytica]|uniref:hypothetical protein n=1 Tax=Mannheimia haemolytica TaxID=75985 RepID=UPI000A48831C|nr:hypothetical protein [Mannheimia haemolytica]MDW0660180.1 hypothetical protein [Mannheimia haemolytica]MDW0662849.1 hypothetical protein [Mannheimia haemolytica]MDW0673609.1 hypothetical protein [Mannheimia haemolytica]MDW0679028.1 hypothetical protein [Mannheimia haemolytica]MDW0684257.1 hypothetical protein [Mannheimia haemolytica]
MKFNVFSERFIYNKPYAHLSLKYLLKILQIFSQLESVYLCQFSKTLSQFIPF